MRWFYLLLTAFIVAGGTLAVDRLTGNQRHPYAQAIVAAALVVIFVSLFGLLSKPRE